MLTTWAVGVHCDVKDLCDALRGCPWTCVVLSLSTAVAESNKLHTVLEALTIQPYELPDVSPYVPEDFPDILDEKLVLKITAKIFIVVAKCKVTRCDLQKYVFDGDDAQSRPCFTTAALFLEATRQKFGQISVGIVDMRGPTGIAVGPSQSEDAAALANWIQKDKIAVATGFWGNDPQFVTDFAIKAHAVFEHPLFQGVHDVYRSRGPVAHPTWYLFFSYYKRIHWKDCLYARIPEQWEIGDDIMGEMVQDYELPRWDMNETGSAFIHNLQSLKMMKVDWTKWIPHVFQTCVWIGSPMPSYSSQVKNKGKGDKGKGDKDKGKGKGRTSDMFQAVDHYRYREWPHSRR